MKKRARRPKNRPVRRSAQAGVPTPDLTRGLMLAALGVTEVIAWVMERPRLLAALEKVSAELKRPIAESAIEHSLEVAGCEMAHGKWSWRDT